MSPSSAALTFALALVAGVVAQATARHLRVPGIVVLLLAGVLLGPDVLGFVLPNALGSGLELIVGISVAVILFEGGLNLRADRLRREAGTIRRLITIGALVTAVGGALAARLFMGWSWELAILFGTLVIVTGPTVITPLLRRVKVGSNLKTILEAEGVLIDPIGAIIAVVVFEVVAGPITASSAVVTLLGVPGRLLLGAVIGLVGGLLIGFVLRRESWIPDNLMNVFTLAGVIALFEISNSILHESGIMAAPVAGMVVGNIQHRLKRELSEFKEQLTVMLVGLLFVLLAADVRLSEVYALGWGGVLTVAALMLVVRPLDAAVCTVGSSLSWRERAFIGWLGPRGIVAAAVASLFAERLMETGVRDGIDLRALVFLVIAATVVISGGLSPLIATLLGVRRPEDRGWLIVGANPIGRLLAHVLERAGEETVLIDSSAIEARDAEEEGLRVIFGNANEERTLMRAEVDARRGFVTATPNDGINLLLSRRATELFEIEESFVTLNRAGNITADQVGERGKRILFGQPIEIQQWYHRLQHQPYRVELWRYEGEVGADLRRSHDRRAGWDETVLLPLALVRDEVVRLVDEQTRIQPGDRVYFVRPGGADDDLVSELRAEGWQREEQLRELSSDGDRPQRDRGGAAPQDRHAGTGAAAPDES